RLGPQPRIPLAVGHRPPERPLARPVPFALKVILLKPGRAHHFQVERQVLLRLAEADELHDDGILGHHLANLSEGSPQPGEILLPVRLLPAIAEGVEGAALAVEAVGDPERGWALLTTPDLPTVVQDVDTRVRRRRDDELRRYYLQHRGRHGGYG